MISLRRLVGFRSKICSHIQRTLCDNSSDYKVVVLNESDIEESFIKGSGPGGQSVNKSSNCVQLRHIPSGIVVKAHESRSLFENRDRAREKLRLQVDLFYNGDKSKLVQSEIQSTEHKQEKKRKAVERLRLKRAFKETEGTSFNGIISAVGEEYIEGPDFDEALAESIKHWKEAGRQSVWITIPIKNSHLIPIAVSHGFVFHHAKPDHVVMTFWMLEGTVSTIPPYCGNNIGVGGVVVKPDDGRLLVIKERQGPYRGWKFPGGSVDSGEDLATACLREVWEETGIKTEFVGILLFRHSYPFRFDTGDTYFICLCRPVTTDAQPDGKEIATVDWKTVAELRAIDGPTNVSPFVREVLDAFEEYQQTGRLITGRTAEYIPAGKRVYTMFRVVENPQLVLGRSIKK